MDIKKIKEDENGVFYEAYDKSKKESENSIGFVLLKNNIGFIYKIYISLFDGEEIDFIDKKFKRVLDDTHRFGSLVYHCENGVPKPYLILPMKNEYLLRIVYEYDMYDITYDSQVNSVRLLREEKGKCIHDCNVCLAYNKDSSSINIELKKKLEAYYIKNNKCNHVCEKCLKPPESSYVIEDIIFKILSDLGHNEYKIVQSKKEDMSC